MKPLSNEIISEYFSVLYGFGFDTMHLKEKRFGVECVLFLSEAMLLTATEMARKQMQLLLESLTLALKYALESGLPL